MYSLITRLSVFLQPKRQDPEPLPVLATSPLVETVSGAKADTANSDPLAPIVGASKIDASAADAINSTLSHSKARGFTCNVCNRTLTRRTQWQNHQYIHLPYLAHPYGCPTCGKKYVSKWALTRHCKAKHSSPAVLQYRPEPHGFEESETSNR